MKVNLKKAARIAKRLDMAMSGLEAKTEVSLNAFSSDKPLDIISNKRIAITNTVDKKLAMVDAVYTIRKLIGDRNHIVGIDHLLANKSALERKKQVVREYTNDDSSSIYGYQKAMSADDVETIQTKFDSLKGSIGSGSASDNDEIRVSLIGERMSSTYQKLIREIENEIISINDKLDALNASEIIEIPESITQMIEEEDIV